MPTDGKNSSTRTGFLIAIGAGLGGAIGIALNNSSFGVAVGVGLGAAIAMLVNWFSKRHRDSNGKE